MGAHKEMQRGLAISRETLLNQFDAHIELNASLLLAGRRVGKPLSKEFTRDDRDAVAAHALRSHPRIVLFWDQPGLMFCELRS